MIRKTSWLTVTLSVLSPFLIAFVLFAVLARTGAGRAMMANQEIFVSPGRTTVVCEPDTPISTSVVLHAGLASVEVVGIDTSCDCLVVTPRPPFKLTALTSKAVSLSVPEGFAKGSPTFLFEIEFITQKNVFRHKLAVDVADK